MKKIVMAGLIACVALMGVGCSSVANKVEKMGAGLTSSDYLVVMYSGGKVVNHWIIEDKIVNTEANSDGYFWVEDGRLHRVSGDVVIVDVKGEDVGAIKKQYGIE